MALVSALVHAAGFSLLVALGVTAIRAESIETPISDDPIPFDVPAQSLSDALYAYSTESQIEVLVPENLVAGLRSTSISGVLAPTVALRTLLSGTGLRPVATGKNAFTLMSGNVQEAAKLRIPRFPEYSAMLQSAVLRALCRLREMQPGEYRIAFRLWVGPSGAFTRIASLDGTGNAERDAVLVRLLEGSTVGQGPPPNIPQPATIVVEPGWQTRIVCNASQAAGSP